MEKKEWYLKGLQESFYVVLQIALMMCGFYFTVQMIIPGFWNGLFSLIFIEIVFVYFWRNKKDELSKFQIIFVHLISTFLLLHLVNEEGGNLIESNFLTIPLVVVVAFMLMRFLINCPRLIRKKYLDLTFEYLNVFLLNIICVLLLYGVFINLGSNFVWLFSTPTLVLTYLYVDYASGNSKRKWCLPLFFMFFPTFVAYMSFICQYWFKNILFGTITGWKLFGVLMIVSLMVPIIFLIKERKPN